jgi:hypothetical protein
MAPPRAESLADRDCPTRITDANLYGARSDRLPLTRSPPLTPPSRPSLPVRPRASWSSGRSHSLPTVFILPGRSRPDLGLLLGAEPVRDDARWVDAPDAIDRCVTGHDRSRRYRVDSRAGRARNLSHQRAAVRARGEGGFPNRGWPPGAVARPQVNRQVLDVLCIGQNP